MTWKQNIATWGATVIAFLLPWQTRWMFGEVSIEGAHTEFGVMSLFVTEILVAIVGIVVLLSRKDAQRTAHDALPLRLGAVACVMIVLGAAFAQNSAFSLAMAMHVLFAFGLFALLCSELVDFKRVCIGFVAGLVPSLTLGVIQVVSGSSPASSWLGLAARDAAQLGDAVFTMDGERMLRAYGTFSHPNVFGGYLGVALFAWWYVLAAYRSYWSYRTHLALGGTITAFLLLGLVLTGSRSAFLGVLLGLALSMIARLVASRRIRPFAVSGAAIAVIGFVLFGSVAFSTIVSEIRGGGVHEERSLTERIELYEAFVPFVAAMNPLVGYGVGSYVTSYAAFDPGNEVFEYQPVHNAFLLAFAEVGILGALALIAFWASLGRCLFHHLPHRDALYALGMVSVVVTIACFDHYLWSSWAGLALCAMVSAATVRLGTSSN